MLALTSYAVKTQTCQSIIRHNYTFQWRTHQIFRERYKRFRNHVFTVCKHENICIAQLNCRAGFAIDQKWKQSEHITFMSLLKYPDGVHSIF